MARTKLFLLYLLVPLLFLEMADAQEFRYDYDYYPETQGWLKLHLIPATWKDARLMCSLEGSMLASPEDVNLVLAMCTVMEKLPTPSSNPPNRRMRDWFIRSSSRIDPGLGVFTGVHATYAKGHFYSIEGTPLARMPVSWAPGEPDNNGNDEECLKMQPGGELEDIPCLLLLPYICYKRQTPDMAVTACGTVDNDYEFEERTNSCYKFHTERLTWSTAFATCSGEGGHLAIINSEIEAQVFTEMYARANASLADPLEDIVSLGFTDLGDHNTWMTVKGQTLKAAGYDKWEPGQPDNENSHCGAMYVASGLLDDFYCDSHYAFICEIDPSRLRRRDSIITTTSEYGNLILDLQNDSTH